MSMYLPEFKNVWQVIFYIVLYFFGNRKTKLWPTNKWGFLRSTFKKKSWSHNFLLNIYINNFFSILLFFYNGPKRSSFFYINLLHCFQKVIFKYQKKTFVKETFIWFVCIIFRLTLNSDLCTLIRSFVCFVRRLWNFIWPLFWVLVLNYLLRKNA